MFIKVNGVIKAYKNYKLVEIGISAILTKSKSDCISSKVFYT